jgi:cytochrome P450
VNLIVLLSEYPSYQDKLVAEFDQVMGGKNPLEITLEDIRSMGQLDAFINEALRFRSPVRGLLPRKAVKDFPLSTETVKKGTKAIYPPQVTS